MAKLIEVCDFQGGSQPPKNEWIQMPKHDYIRMLQIRDFTQPNKNVPEYVKKTNKLKICSENDILIARYGASLGKILTGLSGAYNVAIMRTIPNEKVLTKRYLFYYLNSSYFQTNILNVGTRAAQSGVNKNNLSNLLINCPSINEQKRIAFILDSIKKIISFRKEQLEKFDKLIKARFVEMFGDPLNNDKKWRSEMLGTLTDKIGSGATPKGGKKSYQNKGISFIRSMNVHNGYFDYKNLAHINSEQANQLSNVEVRSNDVFVNITGASIARSCVVPYGVLPARVNQHVSIVRCKSKLLNFVFLNQLLLNSSFNKRLLAIGSSNGATRQAITKRQLENLQIILPPLSLQNEFANFVRQVDKSKFDNIVYLNKTLSIKILSQLGDVSHD